MYSIIFRETTKNNTQKDTKSVEEIKANTKI